MQEKVIATRDQFIKWNNTLSQAKPLSETSVEYREALFIFRDKVERHILKPLNEIFAMDESVKIGLRAYNTEIYNAGLPYAVVPPKKKGDNYEIASDNKEWIKIADSIEAKYKDILEKREKRKQEIAEWCSKKIQLNIEKIELNKLPSLDSVSFYNVAKIICIEHPEEEDEGKEVE